MALYSFLGHSDIVHSTCWGYDGQYSLVSISKVMEGLWGGHLLTMHLSHPFTWCVAAPRTALSYGMPTRMLTAHQKMHKSYPWAPPGAQMIRSATTSE